MLTITTRRTKQDVENARTPSHRDEWELDPADDEEDEWQTDHSEDDEEAPPPNQADILNSRGEWVTEDY